MKRAFRAFWATEPRTSNWHSFLRFLGLVLGAAVLWWLVLQTLQGPEHAPGKQQQAERTWTAGAAFTHPVARLDEAWVQQQPWQPQSLPYSHSGHLQEREQVLASGEAVQVITEWVRLRVPLQWQQGAGSTPLYLHLPRWKSNGTLAIYSDGRLIYQTHTSLIHNGYNTPLLLPLDAAEGAGAVKEVVLRMQRPAGDALALTSLWLGPQEALYWRYQLRQWLQQQWPLAGSAAFLVMGAYALLIWLRRRQELGYLLFFCATSVGYVRMLHYHVDDVVLQMPDNWFQWLTLNSLAWSVLFLHLLLQSLHLRYMPRLTWGIAVFTAVLGTMTLPLWSETPWLMSVTPWINMVILSLALLLFLVALTNTWLSRIQESWVLSGWCSVGVLVGAQDILLQLNWLTPEAIYWAPYSFLGSYASFAFILFRRYTRLLEDVESLNANLQSRLVQREAELLQSHEQLRKSEQQQALHQERQRLVQDMHDGMGYTLTSALRSVEQGQMGAQEVSELLRQCVDDLKLAIDSMEPVDSDVLLLLATLRFRLEPRLQSAGIALRWRVQDVPQLPWLDPKNALHILRILQEALSNCMKHSGANCIEIHVAPKNGGPGTDATDGDATTAAMDTGENLQPGICVQVRDNGQGFDVEAALQQGGRGLHHQRQRAQAIGAQVQWQTGQAGTTMTLWLPLQRSEVDTGLGSLLSV